MLNLSFRQRLFFLGLTGVLLIVLGSRNMEQPKLSDLRSSLSTIAASPSVNPSNSPSNTPSSDSWAPTCISEAKIKEIVGRDFTIQNENLNEAYLSCSFVAHEMVNDLPVRISYTVRSHQSAELWQDILDEQKNKNGYQAVPSKDNLFYVVNPVIEVRQMQVFAKQQDLIIELSYSPIREDKQTMIDKAVKLTEAAISATLK